MSTISKSPEYLSFRSSVSQKKIVVESSGDKAWTVYDAGPKTVRCPLVCLAPTSGTADIFFKQIVSLSSLGYRIIAADFPPLWSHNDWCESFRRLLDHLNLDEVHIFGASLGGFLGQKFAEYTFKSPRVHSLILCNAFADTNVFQQRMASNLFWALPGFMLKRMILSNLPSYEVDSEIADSIDFLVEKLESLDRSGLASRLTLNCMEGYVEPQKFKDIPVTIMDVFDESALTNSVKEDLYKCYPDAKRAHLKSGGNFPYICRSAEVNMHLQIHLRQFDNTKYSSKDPDAEIQMRPVASGHRRLSDSEEEEATASGYRSLSAEDAAAAFS
jgi:maspardin